MTQGADPFSARSSVLVEECQSCGSPDLDPILFLGYLPAPNTMPVIGSRPVEQVDYPAQLLRCTRCELVQLGLIVDPRILFPPDYPYTSGTTRILRENFQQLSVEVRDLISPRSDELVVDIGSNDGTLLSNFVSAGHRVRGIEPTDTAKLAIERGVPTLVSFFGPEAVSTVLREDGPARVVTAANVFAHIPDVHAVIDGILQLMSPDGVFVSESHYWVSLVETVQYDTIYHEHLRYYSLRSLAYLLRTHGLEVFHARRIPTHGGSIRVYAARQGRRPVGASVAEILAQEARSDTPESIKRFRDRVISSKLGLYELLHRVKSRGARVHGIGAPTRASTLINYVGLDEGIIEAAHEITGSQKIGKYIPGTLIPVVEERVLFEAQPEYALLLSWHLADEIMGKLAERGFRGGYIVPLAEARIIERG